jgi:hypothetical protein
MLRLVDRRTGDLIGEWANLSRETLRHTAPPDDLVATCRADLLEVLAALRDGDNVHALRQAIVDGRVDGLVYDGACACLLGTLAGAAGQEVADFCGRRGVRMDAYAPAEVWFYAIAAGDTPRDNPFAARALEWVEEFLGAAA